MGRDLLWYTHKVIREALQSYFHPSKRRATSHPFVMGRSLSIFNIFFSLSFMVDSQLEEQNQHLREQNQKCNEQLELLRNRLRQLSQNNSTNVKNNRASTEVC